MDRYPFYVILGASGVQMRLKNHYNNFVYFLQNSTANYFREKILQEKILQQTILQKKTMVCVHNIIIIIIMLQPTE